MVVRGRFRVLAPIVACAACFFAGGLLVPRIVDATVSSGERDAFFPLPPERILDTREGPSPLPIGVKLGSGQTLDLLVAGQGGVPATASAVVLNITATAGTVASHLRVFPTGQTLPNVSSLNFTPGQDIPNAVTVKLGVDGKVSIFNNAGEVHVVADVNGYYEDHNFDDRYYTKAQVDTAITAPNHITGTQIVNGSLSLSDLATFPLRTYNLGTVTVPASGCTVESVILSVNESFELFVPYRLGVGTPLSALLSAYPVVLNGSGEATIQICNRFAAVWGPFNNVMLEYQLA